MLDFSPSRLLHGQDSEKQLQPNPEPVDTLLADDNRIRKRLPEERGSLLKAISDTLYFTTIHHEEIQEYLIKHLKTLIATNKLPSRLSMFKGNSILFNDFTMSPHLPGFEKINLELVSSAFNVRVTVYGMTEDDYLSSLIINSKHTKQIEFLRTKNNHYDPVYSVDYMKKAGFCQNIVLNIIDQALGINSTGYKDKNKDNYINFEYNNWILGKQNQNGLDQFRITRGRHKKSLSDPYAKNKDASDDQMKIYNIFTNMKPPEDFLSKINMRKDTVESNFSINADLDFVNEQEPPPNNPDFAIKNYPVPSPGYSFTHSHPHEIRPSSPQPQRTRQLHQDDIFFHENLSLAEIERLERTPSNNASTTVSSAYYLNSEPPTFTPTRYIQKGYSYTEVPQHANGGLDNSSPTFKPKESMKAMGIKNYTHSLADTPPQNAYGMNGMNGMGYQQMHPQANAYGHPFMPRGDNMQMPMQVNPYNMNPQAMQPYSQPPIQGNFGGNTHMGNMPTTSKKKQAIMEDGSRRYSGRLKFFDEMKNYGFIIMDEDGSDLFVHYDDLAKANLSKDLLKTAKSGNVIKLTFSCMQYVGKYNKSRKAVDIQVVL